MMPRQRPDKDAPTMLPSESQWWNCLENVKLQLFGRLAGFEPDRRPIERPRRFNNDAAFFEDDLHYILAAKFVVVPLSAEMYKKMDNITLNFLRMLNDNVNEDIIKLLEAQDHHEFGSPEQSSSKPRHIIKVPDNCERLSAMLCCLQARPEDRFSLVTGPDPPLFKFSTPGFERKAMGQAKQWRAFLDKVAAKAMISEGAQIITLEHVGLSEEELKTDHGRKSRAGEIVDAMFKEFRQLNCAVVTAHEIRLRLPGLSTDPAQLDLLVSCCQNGKSDRWHEAQCGSFEVSIHDAGKQSFCDAVAQAISDGRKLHLLVDQEGLFDVTDKMSKISSSSNLKPEALIEKFREKVFSPLTAKDYQNGIVKASSSEKVEIALMLAKCLLDFVDDDIELAFHSWTPEQIFFICPSTTTLVPRPNFYKTLGDIYVSLRPKLKSKPREMKTTDLLKRFKAGNPILLSFARLLLEIETGEKIHMSIDPETQNNVGSWGWLCGYVEDLKINGRSPAYLEAVEGCLHLCDNLPKTRDRVTGSAASMVLRKVIYRKIIFRLQQIADSKPLKRKRQLSVSECPQAKKTSNAPLSGTMSPVAESASSGRNTAMAVSCVTRVPLRPNPSDGSEQAVYSSKTPSYHEQGEQSTTSRLDGRLCESPKASTDLIEPRTFKALQDTWESRLEYKEKDAVIKVAILDTGIDLLHEDFRNTRAIKFDKGRPVFAKGETSQFDRMPIRKSFCGAENDVQDLDGHGTQVASIILRLAPRAELYIARINHGDVSTTLSKNEKQMTEESYVQHPRPDIVVNAIQWAIDKKVNIINLSFGFKKAPPDVDDALKRARDAGILIFAAMANEGMYENAAWPARDSDVAIGIHSCVDMGKRGSSFTPQLVKKNSNFMVAGEGIIAHWLTSKGGGFRSVEGTSFATPVAVAMAAMILAFANQKRCGDLREKSGHEVKVEELWQNQGMRKVLEAISNESGDGYLWINPKLLWAEFSDDGDEDTPVAIREHGWKVIRKALKK